MPELYLLTFYSVCFLLGWYWYSQKEQLFRLENSYHIHFAIGVPAYLIFSHYMKLYFSGTGDSQMYFAIATLLHCLTMWSLSFAIIGMFIKFASGRSQFWRYVADSSYFVYIIHVHVFLLAQALVFFLDIGAVAKLALSSIASMIAALFLYHLFARHTWISMLLNGRKYAWRTSNKTECES